MPSAGHMFLSGHMSRQRGMNIQGDIMYKVAIVDDEPVIVRGLTKMIPWESYNCRVVGTAGDGQEGMKLIREQKPDIPDIGYLYAGHRRPDNDRRYEIRIRPYADHHTHRFQGF